MNETVHPEWSCFRNVFRRPSELPQTFRPPLTPSSYRADIDGLRAVAVLSVLGFHGQLWFLGGGFIGVDVFFVISGYLISGIIFDHLARNDFSFRDFYVRRVNRIFPALITVLVATSLLGWLFMFRGELETLGKHIVVGSVYGSNIVLWTESGYFDSPLKPLLHLWSLAVEEQFYLFFPLVAVSAWKARWNMRWLVVGLIATSFALNIWSIRNGHATAAFYMPYTRIWEILIGGLLAISRAPLGSGALIFGQTANRLREAGSLAGASALLLCVTLMDESLIWPGFWALIPVAATVLIISGGGQSRTNRRLFGNPMLVHIGKISYPLYLWHWPLLVFARLVNERELPIIARIGIVGVSLLLAEATYRIVETPIRLGRRKARSAIRLLPTLGALGAVGAVFAAGIVPPRLDLSRKKSLAEIGADWDAPRGGSVQRPAGFLVYRVNGDAKHGVLLVGDSHVQQYWPRFVQAVARQDVGAPQLELAAYAGCPPLPNVNRVGKSWEERDWSCPAFYQAVMAHAAEPGIEAVVFAGFWEDYFGGKMLIAERGGVSVLREHDPRTDAVFARFERDLAGLTSHGKRVFIVLSNPTLAARESEPAVPRRLAGFVGKRVPPVIARRSFVDHVAPVMMRLRHAAARAGATVIDPVDFLCTGDVCPTVTAGGIPIYRDGDHLRAGYVLRSVDFPDRLLLGASVGSTTAPASIAATAISAARSTR